MFYEEEDALDSAPKFRVGDDYGHFASIFLGYFTTKPLAPRCE